MYYQIYREGIYWRWRLKSANHLILASGEAYHNKADVLHVISLIKGSGNAPIYDA